LLERTPRYDIVLNDKVVGPLTYNMRGYIGYLPTPTGSKLDIGERSISAFKREVAALNREGNPRR
jgi:hypothetical protein